ncbi:MAG: PAC2 family protein [Candidatus ainarchaeum sp.]|nr:PAC2 family protein [Candidatus ainarchaeum sp.]
MEKELNFVETSKMSLKGFTLIEGFPDLGLAGTIGAKYLIDKLDFEEIGYVDSSAFMPITRINKGIPLHPVRIYANKKYKTAIIISEQLIQNDIARLMAIELINYVKKKEIKRVISTSGISIPDGKSVYAFASNEKSKKIIKDQGYELINTGITSGVTALLMLYLKDNNIEAFCLMGNAKNNADYYAAAEIVKAFCSFTKINIDVKPLLEEAKKIESVVTQHLKAVEENTETKIGSKGQLSMYT